MPRRFLEVALGVAGAATGAGERATGGPRLQQTPTTGKPDSDTAEKRAKGPAPRKSGGRAPAKRKATARK